MDYQCSDRGGIARGSSGRGKERTKGTASDVAFTATDRQRSNLRGLAIIKT